MAISTLHFHCACEECGAIHHCSALPGVENFLGAADIPTGALKESGLELPGARRSRL